MAEEAGYDIGRIAAEVRRVATDKFPGDPRPLALLERLIGGDPRFLVQLYTGQGSFFGTFRHSVDDLDTLDVLSTRVEPIFRANPRDPLTHGPLRPFSTEGLIPVAYTGAEQLRPGVLIGVNGRGPYRVTRLGGGRNFVYYDEVGHGIYQSKAFLRNVSHVYLPRALSKQNGQTSDCPICFTPLVDSKEYGMVVACGTTERMAAGTEADRVECGHKFHNKCIHDWIQSPASEGKCPYCKQVIRFLHTANPEPQPNEEGNAGGGGAAGAAGAAGGGGAAGAAGGGGASAPRGGAGGEATNRRSRKNRRRRARSRSRSRRA